MNAQPVFLYDGDCGFCTSAAVWMRRHVPTTARVEPYQGQDLAGLGVTTGECRQAVQWIGPDGSVLRAHAAIAQALVDAGGRWRVLGRLLMLSGISNAAAIVYRFVARHRALLPARWSCRAPRA